MYERAGHVQRPSRASAVLPHKEVSQAREKRGERCARRWALDIFLQVTEDPLKGFRQLDLNFVKNIVLPVLRPERGKTGRD